MSAKQKHLLVLGGPTASGKTGLAMRLAQHFNTAILSADSRQFFKEMSIGTAKPTYDELAAAPHHFVGHLSIQDEYNVGNYVQDVLVKLEELFTKHNLIILTGGSGLYLQAVCDGLDEFPDVPIEIRNELRAMYEQKGLSFLQEELSKHDPDYFAIVDQQNPVRLLRALEVFRTSGQPFTTFRKRKKQPRSFVPIYLQTAWPRETLYQRINLRVEQMMQAGLVQEAEALYPHRHLNALQTVGYQELFDFFEEKHSLERAIELIKQNSRRYAKRQLTWLRRDGQYRAFHPSQWTDIIAYVDWCIEKEGKMLHEKTDAGGTFSLLEKDELIAHLSYQIRKNTSTIVSLTGQPSHQKQLQKQFDWHFDKQ